MTAEMPNASITARQMKNSRLVLMKLQMGEVLRDDEPVVDGEFHDGVVVDEGSEDPPPLLLLLYPLCLLCV